MLGFDLLDWCTIISAIVAIPKLFSYLNKSIDYVKEVSKNKEINKDNLISFVQLLFFFIIGGLFLYYQYSFYFNELSQRPKRILEIVIVLFFLGYIFIYIKSNGKLSFTSNPIRILYLFVLTGIPVVLGSINFMSNSWELAVLKHMILFSAFLLVMDRLISKELEDNETKNGKLV